MRRLRLRRHRFLAALLIGGVAGLTILGLTAGNIVAASKLANLTQAVNVNQLKDPACNGITLTTVIVGNTGNAQANLLLGNSGGNTMNGQGQSDCVMGGGGNDTLAGGGGVDVCIGGPGFDTFNGNCETQIQ